MRISDWSSDVCSSDLSPQVGITSSADYRGYGTLTASAAAAPEKLPALYDAIDGIVADLRDKPIGEDELHRAREPMAERLRQSPKTNRGRSDEHTYAPPSLMRKSYDVSRQTNKNNYTS